MNTAVIAITRSGCQTALRLHALLPCDVYVKRRLTEGLPLPEGAVQYDEPLSSLAVRLYTRYQAFILVMATGIAVRTFAPFLEHKTKDPALVVVDEQANFSISLVSGHLGGANDLAKHVADLLGAVPVITTATDLQDKIAFDNIAKWNGCRLENCGELQAISGAVVNGGRVALLTQLPVDGPLPPEVVPYTGGETQYLVVIDNRLQTPPAAHTLFLRPPNLVLGIGCRRNTPPEQVKKAACEFLQRFGYSPLSICAVASIDLKRDEQAIVRLAAEYGVPFLTFPAEQLRGVPVDQRGQSAFVEQVTGSASVCQAAAVLAAGGKTLVEKTVCRGVTLSLAERPMTLLLRRPTRADEEDGR